MPKLTQKEKYEYLVKAYNKQYNEIFKLHHYLVDYKLSKHSIDSGNPIDDAIGLFDELIKENKEFKNAK